MRCYFYCALLLMVFLACNSTRKQDKQDDCVDTVQPATIEWMKKAIDQHQPNQILKFKYDLGFLYLYTGSTIQLFDCRGALVCNSERPDRTACMENADIEGRGVLVWQAEGVLD